MGDLDSPLSEPSSHLAECREFLRIEITSFSKALIQLGDIAL